MGEQDRPGLLDQDQQTRGRSLGIAHDRRTTLDELADDRGVVDVVGVHATERRIERHRAGREVVRDELVLVEEVQWERVSEVPNDGGRSVAPLRRIVSLRTSETMCCGEEAANAAVAFEEKVDHVAFGGTRAELHEHDRDGVHLACPEEQSAIEQVDLGVRCGTRDARMFRNGTEPVAHVGRSLIGLAELFDNSPIPKALSRLDDGRVVAANTSYLRLFQVTREQLIGRTPDAAGIHFDFGRREEIFARVRAGEAIEGEDVHVETSAGRLEVLVWTLGAEADGVRVAMTTFVDVTERNRDRSRAIEMEERLRQVAESVQEVTWLSNPDNTEILYVSPVYEKMFGRTCAALYRDARDWLLAVHPDDRDRMSTFGLGPDAERTRDRYRIVLGGEVLREIEVTLSPVRDASGTVFRIAGVWQDVTDQLALEEQVRQTQKLESLGLLAGGVAHDFNNVLAVIGSNIGLLGESVVRGTMEHELVEEIEAAVTRATGLTRQLLAFSRKQVVEPVILDLNAAVKDTRKMLRRMVGDDIVISTSLDNELAAVKIDPGYLVQVLMNLAVNARDAMPRGGRLSLTTRNLGGEVLLEITDSGMGMTPAVVRRAFEPFFTTKQVGRGTGLGLSVVLGIIQQAGGRIELDSEPGTGTTFRIYLPATDQPVDRACDVAQLAPGGNERILLVDDDPFVRASAGRSLRARGYAVLEARDAQDALARLREHPDIKLLLTDVMMPGMDGCELAAMARVERPGLKVLFTSGYTDDALTYHGIRPADGTFLEKPYPAHVLAGRVRQIIDAS